MRSKIQVDYSRVNSPNGRIISLIMKHSQLDEKRRFDMLEKILSHCPEEVNSIESKYGGTPLHWAVSKSDVNQLVKHGGKTDVKSNTKDTPLHIMIKKRRTDAAYCLILNGADVTGMVKEFPK